MENKYINAMLQLLDKIYQATIANSSSGGGGASTIADGADVTQGAKADAQATDSTSSWSVIALLKGIRTSLATLSSTIATAAKGGTSAGSPTSRSKSVDVTALDVQVVDASGNPIITFGNAGEVDGVTSVSNTIIQGGKTVDITSLPSTTTGKVRSWLFNMLTGAAIVQQSDLNYLLDSVKSFAGYTSSGNDAPTRYRNTAVTNTKIQVVGAACNLYGWNIINPFTNTDECFLKFYDALSTNVTVGTTVPVWTVPIPAGTATVTGKVFTNSGIPLISFLNGMTIVITKLQADSDTTAPTAVVHVGLNYK